MEITADLSQMILFIYDEALIAVFKQFAPPVMAAVIKINIMAVNEMHALTEVLFIRLQENGILLWKKDISVEGELSSDFLLFKKIYKILPILFI